MSNKGNPILPSEPLSLQPSLIAAAVMAEGAEQPSDDSHSQLSPRNASKVRRRMDIRNYGRSESRGPPSEERRRSSSGRHRGGQSPDHTHHHGGSGGHERQYHNPTDDRDELLLPMRDRSPGDHRFDRRERRSYSPDRGPKRFRIAGTADSAAAAAADGGPGDMQASYYAPNRSNDEASKEDPAPSRVLGIFGMSKFTNESYLRSIFDRYGPIERIQIIRDPYEGRSRGFAFVNMRNVEDAQKARNDITGTMIHDRKVRVDFSFTSRAHPPTPGKYKGQETGNSSAMGGGNYHYSDRGSGNRSHGGGGYRGRGPPPGRPYRGHGAAPSYRMRRRANTRDRRRRDSYTQNSHHHHQPPPPPSHRGGGRQWGGRSKSPGYYSGASRGNYDSYRGPSYHEDGGSQRAPPRDYDDRRARNSRSPGGRYGYSRNSPPPPPQRSPSIGGRRGGFGAYQSRHYPQDSGRYRQESYPNSSPNGQHY